MEDNSDTHQHSYVWKCDDNEHWKQCSCEDTIERGAHVDADDNGICDVCKYVIEIIDDHDHEYVWRHNDDIHWQECSCGDIIDRDSHHFDNGTCVCGAVQDTPTKPEQDTKDYYLVGNFINNWQQTLFPEWKFNRAPELDSNGYTVYVKDLELHEGNTFKIVNSSNTNPADFYNNHFDFHTLRNWENHEYITTSGNNLNFTLKSGKEGQYRITLHTDRNNHSNSYVEIDYLGAIPDPDHQHSFSQSWTTDENFHWHAALCSHTQLTQDKQAHDFVNGVCSVCNYGAPDDVYEFGDAVSIQNDSFYKDYTEEDKNLYYTLWQETTFVSIKIDITPYELAKINEAYDDYTKGNSAKADTYRKCNLTITVNGKDYYFEEVGIRMRGNTSRRSFTDGNGNMYAYVHFRFSLKETFDGEEYQSGAWGSDIYHDWSSDAAGKKVRKDRAFATMEKFYYKWNKNYDQTYIREIYTNRMFQAYGILAPHITLSQISITQNGSMESIGIGGLYEVVDKQFIKRNFDKANRGGDLYKCGWGGGAGADFSTLTKNGNPLYGIETATKSYTYSLKTNDEPADFNNHKYLQQFIQMLQTSKNSSDFKAKLESMVDMDYFARFEAVNYFAGNPDCIRNNSNNYYIYFTPEDSNGNFKTYIIPFDYDRCFGINRDWNPSGDGMTTITPYTTSSPNGKINNPLYTKTILQGGIAEYQKLYQSKLQKVLDGKWFTYDNFLAIYNEYNKNYSSVAMPSQLIQSRCGGNIDMSRLTFSLSGTSNFGSTSSNISMQDYLNAKRQTANQSINNI